MRSLLRKSVLLSLLTSLSLAVSCKDDDDDKNSTMATMSLKIRNTGSGASLTEKGTPSFNLLGAGNVSFTPTSYRIWVSTVVLQGDNNQSNQFYTCDTSAADCEVDFADPASVSAFEAKLSSLPVAPGTYNKVWFSCSPNGQGYVKFKGSVTLSTGVTYYTADKAVTGTWVTTSAAANSEVKIESGGGCGITMNLPQDVVVAESAPPAESAEVEVIPAGTTLTMTMFSNLQLIAYFGLNTSAGLGGCAADIGTVTQSGPGFCINTISVFPYFGTTTPTVDYYKLAHSKSAISNIDPADANVIVKIIKNADGTPFWASFSQYYNESTPSYGSGDTGVSGYANAVSDFQVNADGTLTIKSADNGFAAFQTAAHTGTVKGEGISNGAGTGTSVDYYYSAIPYTP